MTCLLTLAMAVGCSRFPELEDRFDQQARGAAYPDLVPAEALRADLPEMQVAPDARARLDARIAGLRGRAERLRGSVIDSAARARLSQPVEIPDGT